LDFIAVIWWDKDAKLYRFFICAKNVNRACALYQSNDFTVLQPKISFFSPSELSVLESGGKDLPTKLSDESL
jgi:hypothetical protein